MAWCQQESLVVSAPWWLLGGGRESEDTRLAGRKPFLPILHRSTVNPRLSTLPSVSHVWQPEKV